MGKEKKAKEEEKIVITPAVLPEKSAEEEEEAVDSLKQKDKVRDEFAEREKKTKEEEKIIIKPADLSGRGKKPIAEEEQIVMEDVVDVEQVPEDETDARAAKDKVRDHFPEKERKKAEEEKIVITPAVLPKKPESESESEEEEEVKPEPKKKLSKADLKPAVQIKIAAAPEPP